MPDEIPAFDLYAELEVSERASVETIQAAYRSLQLRNHPDRVGPGAGDRAVRLNVARDWLTDAARRSRYDAHLAELRRQATADDADEADGELDEAAFDDEDEDFGPDDAADEEPDDGDIDISDGPGLLHLLRRHLRIDPWRLVRIWPVGLACLGALDRVAPTVPATARRVGIAVAVVGVLVGVALRWKRLGDAGLVGRAVRRAWAVVAWLALTALAVAGGSALLTMARHEVLPAGVEDAVLPALGATALLSLLAVRRRLGPVQASVDDFLAMTPREFETAVGQILDRHGYRLELTGGPGDLVADLTGVDPGGRPAIVQCKRYAPERPVGSREVQLLIAMGVRHHRAEHMVLVTTSDFTDPARDLADEHGVRLVNGDDLEDLTR